jgi:AbiJ N-terminal domain 4
MPRALRAAKASKPETYIYDELPNLLRKQLSLIFTECVGSKSPRWSTIKAIMEREIASYSETNPCGSYERCMSYLETSDDTDGVLSLIEICAKTMTDSIKADGCWYSDANDTVNPAKGIAELNERFLGAGVGYQFEDGRIIRIDNQYLHAEVVKQALRLLGGLDFREANDEFMKAHWHLREGHLRACNTAALRAIENVLKVICDARGWAYNKGDTVERLVAVVSREGLFPDYLGGYFTNLIGAMRAGVPKIRDRQGGHGAAPGDDPVPDHIAAFALHLTAANIVMLVKAHRARGQSV